MLKKILFIHHNSSPVGSSNSLLLILKHLDRSIYKPKVLIISPKGKLHDLLIAIDVEVEYIKGISTYGHSNPGRAKMWGYPPFQLITKALKIPNSLRNISTYLKSNTYDLVYVNSSVLWPAAKASKSLGIKTIIHIREQISNVGLFGIRKTQFRKALEKYNDQLIVLTEASKAQYQKKSNIEVIYNAVDQIKYKPTIEPIDKIKASLALPDDKIILFVGGVLKHKGGLILLDAFTKVLEKRPNTQLVVLGNSTSVYLPVKSFFKRIARAIFLKDNAKQFKDTIAEKGLNNHVILPGPQTNVDLWMKASDVLVFPPTIDHFGRPIIESLAVGKPVVASNLASNTELYQIFKESDLITLFRNGDPIDLASKILSALDITPDKKQEKVVDRLMKSNGFYSSDQAVKVNKVINQVIN